MQNVAPADSPFGTRITPDDILDTLGFFDTWEERYKYIIDLGRELPAMPESLHTEDRLVRGTELKILQVQLTLLGKCPKFSKIIQS